MRNASDSDSRCGLACDASAHDAKSLAMRVERCEPLTSGDTKVYTKGVLGAEIRAPRQVQKEESLVSTNLLVMCSFCLL